MKKKNLLIAIASLISTGVLASCNGGGDSSSVTSTPTSQTSEAPTSEAPTVDSYLDKAMNVIKSQIEDLEKNSTITASFDLIASCVVEDKTVEVKYEIVEAVNNEDGIVTVGKTENKKTKIEVKYPDNTKEVKFKLKYIVSLENHSKEKVSNEFTVPVQNILSFDEFMKAAVGDQVVVRGVITMRGEFNEKNGDVNIWFENTDGGYYAYKLKCASKEAYEKDLAPGNEIIVSGQKDVYNKQIEIKSCTYMVVSTNLQTPNYLDASAQFAAAKDGKDTEALDKFQNRKVELKDVEVLGITENKNGNYYNFKIGNAEMYMRFSTSYGLTKEQLNEMFAEWKQGFKANVKGVCETYSGQFYLQPYEVGSVTITSKEVSDADKIATAKAEVNGLFEEKYNANAEVVLPAANKDYSNVTYAWSVDADSKGCEIVDGKLKITQTAEDQVGKVTVTISLDGTLKETVNISFTIASSLVVYYSVTEALDIIPTLGLTGNAKSEKEYYIYGTVGEITNTEYCNFYLTEGESQILVYGLYATNGTDRYGSKREIAEIPFVTGDKLFVKAKLQDYVKNGNHTLQLADAVLQSEPAKGTNKVNPMNVTEALAELESLGLTNNAKSEKEYYVTGVVGEITNTQYCNFYLTTGESSILVYGLYAANGTDRYGSNREIAEIPFVTGDTLIVKTKLQDFVKNDAHTPQLADAVLVPAKSFVATPVTSVTVSGANTVVAGERITLSAEVTPEGTNKNVTWSSSDETIATVDEKGAVTGVAAGEVTITATSEGKDAAGQAVVGTYKVTVTAPAEGTLKSGFVSKDLGIANAEAFTTYTTTDGNITFTGAKNTGSNDPKYYTSGEALRFYGGNTFTITPKAGATVSKIVIVTSSDTNAIAETNCAVTNGTMTVSGTDVTIVPTDGTAEVVLTNPNTKGNFRVISVQVTYTLAA